MVVFPNAKINLGLNILRKREDGFHDLETCFLPVNWHDVLEILPAKKAEIKLTGIPVPGDPKENLCYKAFQLFRQDFKIPPVKMHLHKVIPIGAGLGGGSSDGAFAIKALAEMFDLIFERDLLKFYAAQLGSDCAFFIDNKPSIATGKGDQLELIELDLSIWFLMLVYPGIHVPTKDAYAGITPREPALSLRHTLETTAMADWKDHVYNDFETSVFQQYPEIQSIKERLYEMGAVYTAMSGSGSSVYGIFELPPEIGSVFPEHYRIWKSW